MKFQITKDKDLRSSGEITTEYYVEVITRDNFTWGKILQVFQSESEAKEFLEKVKHIYPNPDRSEEILYNQDNNCVKIISENEINVNNFKPQRRYTLFHNTSCVNVLYDKPEEINEEAAKLIERIKIRSEFNPQNEVIYQVTINK